MGEYHVGTLNLIANAGIIGLVLFTLFGIRYYKVVTRAREKFKNNNRIKNAMSVLLLGFFGIIIINLTSYQLIGYTISNRIFFFLALFVSFTEVLIQESYNKMYLSLVK